MGRSIKKTILREKVDRSVGFIPRPASIGKTGVPAKFILWGISTVGLSYKAEANL